MRGLKEKPACMPLRRAFCGQQIFHELNEVGEVERFFQKPYMRLVHRDARRAKQHLASFRPESRRAIVALIEVDHEYVGGMAC